MAGPTLEQLRRYAVTRTLFTPGSLPAAIRRLGFVQADPIRAPARAQDLTLRHRVAGYRAGDLDDRYPRLAVEEDAFVNYGFLPRETARLMFPRTPRAGWPPDRVARAAEILAYVRANGTVHPQEIDDRFGHGRVVNDWGGTSTATTNLLERMHYVGMLRVAARAGGVRCYAARDPHPAIDDPDAALDALVDVVVRAYAPLPARSLSDLVVTRLAYCVPQWRDRRAAALARARARLARATVAGVDWFWPVDEQPASRRYQPHGRVRFLAPFDPIVWDRRRFEVLWNWQYRFEAYTPAAKRVRGYYALPVLWQNDVIGWANLTVRDGTLHHELGFVDRAPTDPMFARELDDELVRCREFLSLA